MVCVSECESECERKILAFIVCVFILASFILVAALHARTLLHTLGTVHIVAAAPVAAAHRTEIDHTAGPHIVAGRMAAQPRHRAISYFLHTAGAAVGTDLPLHMALHHLHHLHHHQSLSVAALDRQEPGDQASAHEQAGQTQQ